MEEKLSLDATASRTAAVLPGCSRRLSRDGCPGQSLGVVRFALELERLLSPPPVENGNGLSLFNPRRRRRTIERERTVELERQEPPPTPHPLLLLPLNRDCARLACTEKPGPRVAGVGISGKRTQKHRHYPITVAYGSLQDRLLGGEGE